LNYRTYPDNYRDDGTKNEPGKPGVLLPL
jgi:hypothetical protein